MPFVQARALRLWIAAAGRVGIAGARLLGAAGACLLGVAAVGCSLVAAPAGAEPPSGLPSVIVISLDGVRHDQLERPGLPALERMAREGGRAAALLPVFPSSTFPNHVALATGAPAGRHGILANRFRDPERGEFDYADDASWIQAEPLWVAAERHGVPSAVYFWVGSQTDWHGVGARYRRAPFDDAVGEEAKVDQLLAWLDLPAAERPRLLLSWWHGADSAGHRYGPEAAQTRRQLVGQDRQLARLLAGLDARGAWPTTTLLVVSDHGMAEVREALDARAALAARDIPSRVYAGGGFALVYLDDPARADEARSALLALPGVEVHPGDRLPAHWRYRHPTRTPTLVLTTSPPRFLSGRGSRRLGSLLLARLLGRSVGAHGYDPATHPEMAGVLLALGRGVRPGARFGRVSVLDVAPSVAALLDISPPRDSEGAPIPGLAAAGPRAAQ